MTTLQRSLDFADGCWKGLGASCMLVFFNLFWVAMLAAAAWYGYGSYTLTVNGDTAVGTVVENQEVDGSDGITYSPVIEYEVDGVVYTYVGENSSSPPDYAVGETVTVRYNRDDHAQARINSVWELWLVPAILCPAALVLAVVLNAGAFIAWRRGQFGGDDD
jgi:hypothetical protein